jgi:hypothetical protein
MVKKYYRMEKVPREVGDIFMRSGDPPLAGNHPHVELILARQKPEMCLPRGESINMREDRDFLLMGIEGDSGYVHELEPLCPVETRDVAWIGALQERYPSGTRPPRDNCPGLSDDQIASRYWSGSLSDKPSLEFATKKAKVISVDEEPSLVRPSPFAEALKQVRAFEKKYKPV